jgi:hypothetical protein
MPSAYDNRALSTEDPGMVVDLERGLTLGQQFIDALMSQNRQRISSLFAPDSVLRAVVPNEQRPFREKNGGDEAAEQVMEWFGYSDHIELLEAKVDKFVDRIRISYRIRQNHPQDGWVEVEQQAFADVGPEGFVRVNLTCSGMRSIETPTRT